jgi:prepilin-type N-terminal cleavage/methylation domain-containing protein
MRRQNGFTIIELLLAMAFFSFILMLVVAGFIQINRSYTRGLTVKQVQNSARSVIDEISSAIRDAEPGDVLPASSATNPPFRLCIGGIRYAWNQANASNNALTTDAFSDTGARISLARTNDGAPCNNPIQQQPSGAETVTLLDDTLALQYLNVSRIGTTNSFKISLVLSTANSNDFTGFGLNAACTIQTGDQYCDVAKVETVVTTRN